MEGAGAGARGRFSVSSVRSAFQQAIESLEGLLAHESLLFTVASHSMEGPAQA